MSGKQIKLFLIDGTPGGLTTAEITNWTGHVLSARRSDLADLLTREEAQRTGAYLLLGDEEAVGNTRCYIGEADIVADRLRDHQRKKEFWDRVVVITSKDANLTKAHGRYLESKLVSLATQAGRVTLDNSTAPPSRPCPRRISQTWTISCPNCRSSCRCSASTPFGSRSPSPRLPRSLRRPHHRSFGSATSSSALMLRRNRSTGSSTMLAGSFVVASWHGVGKARSTMKAYASYRAQHEQLLANGAIAVEAGRGRVTRNIVFPSSSTAGAVALGRSCNGRREWISAEGTFGEWESRGVE
jgi:hypothetical protein